jgi:hypothetical protein
MRRQFYLRDIRIERAFIVEEMKSTLVPRGLPSPGVGEIEISRSEKD